MMEQHWENNVKFKYFDHRSSEKGFQFFTNIMRPLLCNFQKTSDRCWSRCDKYNIWFPGNWTEYENTHYPLQQLVDKYVYIVILLRQVNISCLYHLLLNWHYRIEWFSVESFTIILLIVLLRRGDMLVQLNVERDASSYTFKSLISKKVTLVAILRHIK